MMVPVRARRQWNPDLPAKPQRIRVIRARFLAKTQPIL
jgi:hypothetical protein